jgi:hypothetical protein
VLGARRKSEGETRKLRCAKPSAPKSSRRRMKPILDRTKSKAEAYARAQHRRASTSLFHRVAGGHKQHRRHSHPELLVCRIRLTNSFFLKDRCSLSDQISFILASNRRAFILAMRERDRANKNEIEIFIFSVTSNDFPHDMLLLIFSLKIGAAIRCQGVSGRSLDRLRAQPQRIDY